MTPKKRVSDDMFIENEIDSSKKIKLKTCFSFLDYFLYQPKIDDSGFHYNQDKSVTC